MIVHFLFDDKLLFARSCVRQLRAGNANSLYQPLCLDILIIHVEELIFDG